jgi:hypothetical protein
MSKTSLNEADRLARRRWRFLRLDRLDGHHARVDGAEYAVGELRYVVIIAVWRLAARDGTGRQVLAAKATLTMVPGGK